MTVKGFTGARALCVCAGLAAALIGGQVQAADVEGGSGALWTTVPGATAMTIRGPGGFVVTVEGSSYSPASQLPDGAYHYQVYAEVALKSENNPLVQPLNNGRSEAQKRQRRDRGTAPVAAGSFRILGGAVLVPGASGEEE